MNDYTQEQCTADLAGLSARLREVKKEVNSRTGLDGTPWLVVYPNSNTPLCTWLVLGQSYDDQPSALYCLRMQRGFNLCGAYLNDEATGLRRVRDFRDKAEGVELCHNRDWFLSLQDSLEKTIKSLTEVLPTLRKT